MKQQTFMATGIIALFLLAGSINVFAKPSGAVAQGNISVYKAGQLVDKFTGQNPVDDESLLACDGQCMIKATGVSLVGASGTQLAIKNEQGQFNLLLKQGSVEFVLTDRIGKMGFYTSDGQYTVADVIFNASTAAPVRGYMRMTDEGGTKIGLHEGRMVFDTAKGAKTVDSNNYILLAQADVGNNPTGADEPAEEEDDDDRAGWWSGSEVLIGSTVVAATVVAGVVLYAEDDDNDDDFVPSFTSSANNSNASVETTPPSQTPSGTPPNSNANSTPPASPRNPSPNI